MRADELLVEDGIELGARTLDILMELVSRPCDVVEQERSAGVGLS